MHAVYPRMVSTEHLCGYWDLAQGYDTSKVSHYLLVLTTALPMAMKRASSLFARIFFLIVASGSMRFSVYYLPPPALG